MDAGLQAERTVLAWRRTQLALLLLACLTLRCLGRLPWLAMGLCSLLLLGAWLLVAVQRRRYRRGQRALRGGQGAADPLAVIALAGGVALVALAALLGSF